MSDTKNVTNIDDARESTAASTTRPAIVFNGSGGVSVAVNKNKSSAGFDNYSARIERTYKDDADGSFKSTPSLRDVDLLRAQKLLNDADNWIEQDKGKNKSINSIRAMA